MSAIPDSCPTCGARWSLVEGRPAMNHEDDCAWVASLTRRLEGSSTYQRRKEIIKREMKASYETSSTIFIVEDPIETAEDARVVKFVTEMAYGISGNFEKEDEEDFRVDTVRLVKSPLDDVNMKAMVSMYSGCAEGDEFTGWWVYMDCAEEFPCGPSMPYRSPVFISGSERLVPKHYTI